MKPTRIRSCTIICVVAVALLTALSACSFSASSGGDNSITYSGTGSITIDASTTHVSKIPFGTYAYMDVTIENLSSQSIFLSKVNSGASTVAAANTGYKTSLLSTRSATPSMTTVDRSVPDASLLTGGITRIEHAGAMGFNSNPPPLPASTRTSIAARSSAAASSSMSLSASYSTGDTKEFWVEKESSSPYIWFQISATLVYTGSHCYVWVATGNGSPNDNLNDSSSTSTDNQITTTQATNLALKFDSIYPVETNLLGYENGGDSSGGVDGDKKISILVYDISGDYTSSQSSGILGYFWGKDESGTEAFTDTDGTTYKSNKAEMFYVDSYFTDAYPETIYSTLIHEFQHMINFNQKYILHNLDSPTWYNEMMSMAAEETIGTYMGISATDLPWALRMPLFTGYYDAYDLTAWQTGSTTANLASYSNSYAFGSYLMHNYGAAAVLRAMELNTSVGMDSVAAAVNSVKSSSYSFNDIYARFGEALVFGSLNLPSTVNSFYTEPSYTVGGLTYPTPKYDILGVNNFYSYYGITRSKYVLAGDYGISVYDNSSWNSMPGHTTAIYSESAWQNATGTLTFTLSHPADSNIDMYLYMR